MSSVQTSSKVIVVRKGKRKRSTFSSLEKQNLEGDEDDVDLSEESSSHEEDEEDDDLHTPSATGMPRPLGIGLPISRPSSTFSSNYARPTSVPLSFERSHSTQSASYPQPHATNSVSGTATNPSKSLPVNSDQEDDEEEDEDLDLDLLDHDDTIKNKLNQSREQMKYILENLTSEQMHRYETFRRVGFSRSVIKKIIQTVLGGQLVNPNCIILMSGIAKVFVGELVEEAKDVMEEWKDSDPLLPSHLMEAHRRLKDRLNIIPHCNRYKMRRNI